MYTESVCVCVRICIRWAKETFRFEIQVHQEETCLLVTHNLLSDSLKPPAVDPALSWRIILHRRLEETKGVGDGGERVLGGRVGGEGEL